jgi:pimeloyl-ACP methyl ester carboxylesterase
MWKSLFAAASMMLAVAFAALPAAAQPADAKPTIVLVHGAFADSSSWAPVIERLKAHGFRVRAAANQLRSLSSDTDSVAALLKTIKGPVVLVGHSYGGMVISSAAKAGDVRALVYVAAFAPETGESALALTGKFPGSQIGDAIAPAPIAGGVDLYIQREKFHDVFAQDVGELRAGLMWETQRPATQAALSDGAGGDAAWKSIPSWFVYGDSDHCIPPAAHAFMAARAKAKDTVVVKGASHVVMLSHPDEVAKVIEAAAASVH